ncbi:hypothetical protein PM082_009727 [Marasmius tenuissimus]|nr:hypothetical protein PM082_009727 [Marasmius tenuissimus]
MILLLQIDLRNRRPPPAQPGPGSFVDLFLIPPHKFNVPIGFKYTGGCSDGATCSDANCPPKDALHNSTDTQAQHACEADDAGLEITFCPCP